MLAKRNENLTQESANNNVRGFEKAAAFLNVSIQLDNGRSVQLGGIPLLKSKEVHQALIEHGSLDNLILECDLHIVQEREGPITFATRS
jgi:hydroxypyruvate isomerase